VILYDFSKLQLKHTKGVRFISRTDPWKVLGVHSYAPGSQLHPWKEVRVSNVVQGQGGGATGRIPATSLAALGGEVAGEGLGVTRERFVCLHAAGRGSAGGHGGRRRRRPLEALLRRAGGLAWTASECGSPLGPREGIGSTVLAATRPEHGVHRGTRGGGNGGLVALCSLA
jgi:hypothetical protein